MNGWLRRGLVSFTLLLASWVGVSCSTPQALDGSTEPVGWQELRTPNFVIYHQGTDHWAERIVVHLQSFRHYVLDHLQLEGADNPLPFRVVLLRNAAQMQNLLGEKDIFGAYMQTWRGGLAVVDLSARAEDGTSSLQVTQTPYGPHIRKKVGMRFVSMDGVLHEYVHHLIANDTRHRYPLWFNEGYAEFLSTYEPLPGNRALIGAPSQHRLASLKNANWMLLEQLMRQTGYQTAHGRGDFYAQSWAVVHYLLSDKERAEYLGPFLDLLAGGVPPEQAFEQTYNMALKSLSAKARSKTRQYGKRMKPRIVSLPNIDFPKPVVRELVSAEVLLLLSELNLSFGADRKQATKLVQQVIDMPGVAAELAEQARAELASIRYGQSDYAGAEALLENHVRSAIPDVQVVLGHLYADKAIDLLETDEEAARKALIRARWHYRMALTKGLDHPQALMGLGRTFVLTPNAKYFEEGREALQRAHKLLPMNMEAPLLLGHLAFSQKEYKAAQEYYRIVLDWARDPNTTRRARESLLLLEQENDRNSASDSVDGSPAAE
jgi:tetratricopeptide (TPR) repeat protein